VDTEQPEITLIGPERIRVRTDSVYRDWGATATDDSDGVITDRITTPTDPVDTSNPGTYEVTYSVEDSAGNQAIPKTRIVIVEGDASSTAAGLRPVITPIGNNVIEVELGTSYVDQGATATDQEDGDISSGIDTANPVDSATLGTYNVTYNITDSAGQSADQRTRTVHVVEDPHPTSPDLKPVITPIGDNVVEVAQHSVYVDPGATATDEDDGDVTVKIVTNDPVDTAHPGTYTVTYSVTDSAGQQADPRTRTVHVIEQPEQPPEPDPPKAVVIVALTDNEGDRPPLSPGDELEYTVWFANLGGKDATVSFELELPRGVSPLDAGECVASPCGADLLVPADGKLVSRTVDVVIGDDAPNLLIATGAVAGDEIPGLRDQEPTVLRSDD
jgi:hypothetical protein